MGYDLNGGGGGVLADNIDWGSITGPSSDSGVGSGSSGGWQNFALGAANALAGIGNAYGNIRGGSRVSQNPDAIVTTSDRAPSQDYELRVPQQVGLQLNTGMLLLIAVGALAFVLLKD